MQCGGCYFYRKGLCKNKNASTYDVTFASNSQGCQMYLTKMLIPFKILFATIFVLAYIPWMIINMFFENNSSSSNGSYKDGFEI
jgi:hypothetical protein